MTTKSLKKRNPKSRFPRMSESGGLTGTRLSQIVDKHALVASSQANRNPHYRTYESEGHRERAPGRHHPNRGKRSHGTIDSDLEHMTGHVGGQNSKPLSQQKLRKRRKRAKKGHSSLDLPNEEDLSSLEKIPGSDSSENRRSSARRRHKSHMRENTYTSPVVKENRRRRIKSCDRSPTNSADIKSLSDVKDGLRNTKPDFKKSAEDVSLEEEDPNSQTYKQWKRLMVRHCKTSAPECDGDLPADYWEKECREANELIASLRKSTIGSRKRKEIANNAEEAKNSEQSESNRCLTGEDQALRQEEFDIVYKASMDYDESYTKFQNSRRFGTGLKQSDKKKLKHFTTLIKDKVRNKNVETYKEHTSGVKSEQDDDGSKVSHSPKIAKSTKGNTTKSSDIKHGKIKVKQCKDSVKDKNIVQYSQGKMKGTMEDKKKNDPIEDTRSVSSCKNSLKKNVKREKKDFKEKTENAKKVCKTYNRRNNSHGKGKETGDKIVGNLVQRQSKKAKSEQKTTCNVNVVDASENFFSEKKMKCRKISKAGKLSKRSDQIKPTAAPMESLFSIKQAITVLKRPLVPKCNKSLPIRPNVIKHATPKPDRKEDAKPITHGSPTTSPSKRLASAKLCYTISERAITKRDRAHVPKATGSAKSAFKPSYHASGRKVLAKSVIKGTKLPLPASGIITSAKPGGFGSETLVATKVDIPGSVKPASRRQCIPVWNKSDTANACSHYTNKISTRKLANMSIKAQTLPKSGHLVPERPVTAKPGSPSSKITVAIRNEAAQSSRHYYYSPSSERIGSAKFVTVLTERTALSESRTPVSGRSTSAEPGTFVSKIPVCIRNGPHISNRSQLVTPMSKDQP